MMLLGYLDDTPGLQPVPRLHNSVRHFFFVVTHRSTAVSAAIILADALTIQTAAAHGSYLLSIGQPVHSP